MTPNPWMTAARLVIREPERNAHRGIPLLTRGPLVRRDALDLVSARRSVVRDVNEGEHLRDREARAARVAGDGTHPG